MNKLIITRSRLAAGATCALAAVGGLVACGDSSPDYSYDTSDWHDSGTYRPQPPPGYDSGGPTTCAMCGGATCVDLGSDLANCGACGHVCPGSDHGAAACGSGACGLTCDTGFESRGGACARVIPPPRPIAPLSSAIVTSVRPSLRWILAPTTDGAEVDICPTRACDRDVETFSANGDGFVPPKDLAPGPHFWRLHGRAAKQAGAAASPTWELFVGHRSAPVDTSIGHVADFNGDGYADIVVAEPGAGRVYVYWGGPAGITDAKPIILTLPVGGSVDSPALVVATAGDLDGDGFADLVVADAAHDRVLVYRGGPDGPSDASVTTIASPFPTSATFGGSVAAAGDVDGDGYADLVVGAPGNHAVQIYRGGAKGISNDNAVTLTAPEPGSTFGIAVAGAGDIDGDGYADVIVGASTANAGAGRIYVFLGGPTMLARGPSLTIDGPDVAFGGFGGTVAMAGDVNGDGYADVLVGAPTSISRRGRAYLFLGSASGLPLLPSTQIDGVAAGDSLGASLAGVGDLDGDGFADIAIGSPGVASSLGRVDVFRGSAAGLVVASRITLLAPDGENFGAAIGGSGDSWGDGFADLVVGARGANHAYVYRGGALGIGADPSVTLLGPDTTTRTFGRAVALLSRRWPFA